MGFKLGLFCAAFFACSFATPTPVLKNSIHLKHVDPNARIVGGTQALPGGHPHMVALTTGLTFRSLFCGGSLIGPQTVLTAAHCVEVVYTGVGILSSARAVVGTNRWDLGGEVYEFSRNLTHPHYVNQILKNDISLLFTTTEVIFSPIISPIALSYEHIGEGVDVKAAGFGQTGATSPLSIMLLELTVTTIDADDCVRRVDEWPMRSFDVEPEIELCTFHSPGHGMCNGDSGSALTRVSDGKQVGLVSWGFPCAVGAPDMFVRISAYEDFITSNVM